MTVVSGVDGWHYIIWKICIPINSSRFGEMRLDMLCKAFFVSELKLTTGMKTRICWSLKCAAL